MRKQVRGCEKAQEETIHTSLVYSCTVLFARLMRKLQLAEVSL